MVPLVANFCTNVVSLKRIFFSPVQASIEVRKGTSAEGLG